MSEDIVTFENKVARGVMDKIFLPIVVVAIGAAVTLWSDQRVTSASLTEHKAAEEARLSELRQDIRILKDEIRGDLQQLRFAIEKVKK